MTIALPADTPISIADLFTIGVGPSSSHTVGPMRAARRFAANAAALPRLQSVHVTLYGSLALTGLGHATDTAILMGLSGEEPESIDPSSIAPRAAQIRQNGQILLDGRIPLPWREPEMLDFAAGEFHPGHANAMRFVATGADGAQIEEVYFSIGGGAILREGDAERPANLSLPCAFSSAEELLRIADARGATLEQILDANEAAWRPQAETDALVDAVRAAMAASIDAGCQADGILPGGLNVKRRARAIHDKLVARGPRPASSTIFEWVSLWALAVNEENAAGGRVVTSPTNGAAGVIPAVLRYYEIFTDRPSDAGARALLKTAAIIGMLYKKRASISAAEMGCQGEVGVACSMAAGGLVAALGGCNRQIENAAEIGMEHNLGLTCDPIGGLVQIPCIERNTMGAIKAINAAYLALQGDGAHLVSLDAVIETMRQTGEDMRSKYKETSLGGLAVNVVAC
ncbi:MAG: L-serine ammonia-lyase [Sphingomonadaceae bacterium]|nr:L-serine ammonia-lyase [Sphingomonadaceae bacterium]